MSQSDNRHDAMPPGTVFLAEKNESLTILHPTPSNDPNDPLNWSKLRKTINFTLALLYVLFTFVLIDIQFVAYTQYIEDVGMTTFVYTTSLALNYTGLAVGCIFFVPLIYKYGRRPIYVASLILQLACAIWSAKVKTNGELMASNLVMGLGGAISETIVQITIADLFFVHQYATANGLYLLLQGTGANLGPVAAGYVVDSQGWRWMWWWCTIFLAVNLLLVLFFFEETAYTVSIDGYSNPPHSEASPTGDKLLNHKVQRQEGLHPVNSSDSNVAQSQSQKKSLKQRYALVTKSDAPIARHFYQPFILLVTFPGITYAAITYGALLVWFSIIITIATEYLVYPPYNFSASALGLVSVSPFIGSLIGGLMFAPLSDWLIVRLARKNNGIYEPEMRLWLSIPGAVICSAGLAMFGFGLANFAGWPVLVIGYGIFSVGFVVCGDVAMSYVIDSYRDIVGDGFVGIIFMRNALSVMVLFSLTPWMTGMGLTNMFILCTVLSLVVGLIPVLFMFWGKRARQYTAERYRHYASVQPGHRYDRE